MLSTQQPVPKEHIETFEEERLLLIVSLVQVAFTVKKAKRRQCYAKAVLNAL